MVIDADTDVKARWQSLRDRLINVGYQNVPTDPTPDGTILDPPAQTLLPRVGIWIMPDNQTNGILEDFLRFLVPQEGTLFDHVQSSVATIPKADRRFSPTCRAQGYHSHMARVAEGTRQTSWHSDYSPVS